MRIFLSYASEDRAQAEAIDLALRAQGHDVFFDRDDLPAGHEYDIRIRRAIERAHLFVFLATPDALSADSYARTELAIAQKTWHHPGGRLLPVVRRGVTLEQVPAYLKSVTLLQPEGNVAAAVSAAVHHLVRARRRATLLRAAAGAVASIVLAAAAYAYLTRAPAPELTGRDGAVAVRVPAGTFQMGDDEHSPLREVYLDAFYIDQHEVTVRRYGAFLEATGRVEVPDGWADVELAGAADLPVVGVDWFGADAYCRWAGRRLPTDAEWEKAARGESGRRYPWGDEEPSAERATFANSTADAYDGGLSRVGSREAGRSPYGAYDMAGNAAEWVADWHEEAFTVGDVHNPQGPPTGSQKVVRGGGWHDPAERMAAAFQMFSSPENRWDDLGFRCARDATS